MPAVFVHGVPDTAAMWGPLLDAVDRRDVVTLSLPGFGVPSPAGWPATKEDYTDWLAGELAAIGEPVDLVAHDWGALLAQRVASTRPELIRTLACGSGPLDRQYSWHPAAQAFQTPELGEQVVDGIVAMSSADRATVLIGSGMPLELAALEVDRFDTEMARCILALYRSAVTVGAEWQPAVEAMPHRPAHVFHGADDTYLDRAIAERLAARLGAELTVYPDCHHWWPWERATETATTLTRLWA